MSNWPLLSVLIWLPILGGALVLAVGNARASAARWLTLATFELRWDCRFVAALTTSRGPIIQPTRQPGMAQA